MSLRLFSIGFALSLLPFAAANIYSYRWAVPACCHQFAPFGYPLEWAAIGGYFGDTHVLLFPGLITDIVIWLGSSVLSGWVVAKAGPRIPKLVADIAAWHSRTRM
jgi:hypothetical protein